MADTDVAAALVLLARARLAEFRASDRVAAYAEAMDALDRAATIYDELGAPALGDTLLVMADALLAAAEPDTAAGVYARVATEPRYGAQVRGRAALGLAEVAVHRGDRPAAVAHLEGAVHLLLAARDPAAAPLLGQIADWVEGQLVDPAAAAQIRRAARAL